MLHLGDLDTVWITKVKGHADKVWFLTVGLGRLTGKLMEAADFGRRRVRNAVIDARRNLSGICGSLVPCCS